MIKHVFSTDMLSTDLSPAEKARHWADSITQQGEFDVDCPRVDNFQARIEVATIDGIEISRSYATSIRLQRTKRHIRATSGDTITLLISAGGRSLGGTQRKSEIALRRGEALVVDQSEPNSTYAENGGQALVVTMPRKSIESLRIDCGSLAGRRIGRGTDSLGLLRGYIGLLLSDDTTLGKQTAAAAGNHLIELAALAMGAPAGQLSPLGAGVAARVALLIESIQQRAGEPGLDAENLGRPFGLSGRSVQHLLQQAATAFSDELREARVARATAMLRDRSLDHLSVTEIAFACGFSDLSTFYRAIKRYGGASPADLRSEQR